MNFVETILASQHGRGGGAPRFFPANEEMEPVIMMRRLAFAGTRRISKEGADRQDGLSRRRHVASERSRIIATC
jgi:hypothetical protein